MTSMTLAAFVVALLLGIGLGVAWRPLRRVSRRTNFTEAKRAFHQQRERLEAKFYEMASQSGKPRGLRWGDCDFDDDVAYARDRKSGQLSAFVGVTISFEAIEGGPMEHVEAVGNLRAATAVFGYAKGRWNTAGKVVFNLSPAEAIAYYQRQIEPVGQDIAAPR